MLLRFLSFNKHLFLSFVVFLVLATVIDMIVSGPTDGQISALICIVMLALAVNFVMKMAKLSFRISGRSIFQAIVRFYRWVTSIRIG